MVSLTLPLVLETTEVHLTDEQFYQLCRSNPDLTIERSAKGALIVMTPVGGEGGSYEADNIVDLGNWNRQTGRGKVFSSSTLFNPMEAIAPQMRHGWSYPDGKLSLQNKDANFPHCP